MTRTAVAALYERRTTRFGGHRPPLQLKPQLHSRVRRAAKCQKTENFRVVLVRKIVDPAEDRHVRVDFVSGGEFQECANCNARFSPVRA